MTVLDVPTKTLKFQQFLDGPFSGSKFVIRRDYSSSGSGSGSASDLYYAVSTNVTAKAVASGTISARNNLVFSVSSDLLHWRVCKTLLHDDTGFSAADSARFTGFEYPDWVFDGADIVVGIRTAYRGAVGAGSSNRMTSLRIVGYRAACGLLL